MLYIGKKDIAKIDRSLILNAIFHAYELLLDQNYTMPDRIHVEDGGNTLLLMPCFEHNYFATKLVSVFPGASQFGAPAVNGIMTLADNKTGMPLAVMDGAALTAERTGAVGGLAIKILTRENIETAGVIGAGVQGLAQARYLLLNRRVKQMMIFNRSPEAAFARVAVLATAYPDVNFKVAQTADSLVKACELVVAATTSKTPVFSNDPKLVKGKTFISIGSFRPDMKEFPDAVIETADRVFVDTPFASKECGDLSQPLEHGIVKDSDLLAFAHLVREPLTTEQKNNPAFGTLFFKSVGMALFDLTVASTIYEFAQENDLGIKLDF
ncbi:ornithine cyclodeaminase family protein [Desulfobacter hydrogenophilus]|uniref:ornithine cyclodeaminase family protein n=1 Tax=Desulfobacter hydrogenophilus TaxID=2291 RepID=UPI0013CFB81D|nr:ornithine cyclodeaminase family protein [Desulfobacter hydrogenophilus]NDY70833.1 ornithine cyclodeaminase family protein [Desulfobacter hydrogenophilus]